MREAPPLMSENQQQICRPTAEAAATNVGPAPLAPALGKATQCRYLQETASSICVTLAK